MTHLEATMASGPQNYATDGRTSGTRLVERIRSFAPLVLGTWMVALAVLLPTRSRAAPTVTINAPTPPNNVVGSGVQVSVSVSDGPPCTIPS